MLLSFYSNVNSINGAQFPTLFSWLCHQLSLDPNETFSDKYLNQLQRLDTANTYLPEGLTTARNIRDMVAVLRRVVSRLGLGAAGLPTEGKSSDFLRIMYIYQANGTSGHAIAPAISYSGRIHGGEGHSVTEGRVKNAQHPVRYHPYAPGKTTRQPHHKPASKLQVFHEHHTTFEHQLVQRETAFMLKFWHGQRKMSGPSGQAEVKSKCGPCAFSQQCPH